MILSFFIPASLVVALSFLSLHCTVGQFPLFPFLCPLLHVCLCEVQDRLSLPQSLLFRKQELGRVEPLPMSCAKQRSTTGGFSVRHIIPQCLSLSLSHLLILLPIISC